MQFFSLPLFFGNVFIDRSSPFNAGPNGSIYGNITNAGTIYWQTLDKVLTVNSNTTSVTVLTALTCDQQHPDVSAQQRVSRLKKAGSLDLPSGHRQPRDRTGS